MNNTMVALVLSLPYLLRQDACISVHFRLKCKMSPY